LQPAQFNAVLFVDDDDINNFINKHIIHSLKITGNIFLSRNGQEGLDFLSNYVETNNSIPELIFVDLNMPLMDGVEFIEQLIQAGFKSKFQTTIIVLTTSTNPADKSKFEELGIKYYLNKPLSKESVLDLLGKISINIVTD
jgi:CheY-like chemotaxis protein